MLRSFKSTGTTIVFLSLAMVACEPFLLAQSSVSTGVISGRVLDSSGTFIVGADIVMTNPSNGYKQVRASRTCR
jgi:hypothetical protein